MLGQRTRLRIGLKLLNSLDIREYRRHPHALHPVDAEHHLARVQVQQTAEHGAARPGGQIVRRRLCVVPDQPAAAVEGQREFVVADAVALVAEERRVLGGPADLHDAGRHDQHLVVPAAGGHLERAAHTLERVRVAARLQAVRRDLQVLGHVFGVQHDVHVGHVHRFVRVLACVQRDCG